jgi:hypothetical protein
MLSYWLVTVQLEFYAAKAGPNHFSRKLFEFFLSYDPFSRLVCPL